MDSSSLMSMGTSCISGIATFSCKSSCCNVAQQRCTASTGGASNAASTSGRISTRLVAAEQRFCGGFRDGVSLREAAVVGRSALGAEEGARCSTSVGLVVPRCSSGREAGSEGGGQWWETKKVRSGRETGVKRKDEGLKAGSAIVITEAPPMLKTAEPMPMMRPNNGLINAGDAGRVIDRRPKDVWAVRFAIGAYLVDRKYFEPLDL